MFPGQGRHGYQNQNQGYDDLNYDQYGNQGNRGNQGRYQGQQNYDQGYQNNYNQGQYNEGQGQYSQGQQQGYQGQQQGYQGQGQGQGYNQGQGYSQGQGYQDQGLGNGLQKPTMQTQTFGGGSFQYSDCTGPKKAVLVGINYTGTSNQLNGCINDAHNVERFLLTKGFSKDNIVILTDDSKMARAVPTRQNILDAMRWLVKDAQPSSSLWFSYLGHGVQVEDTNGDEDDGFDEAICPLDYETAGLINDDEMHDIMVAPLRQGVRLTALFDSCHSGTVLDIPYMYSTKGLLKEPNFLKDAGEGLLSTFNAYSKGDQKGMMTGLKGIFNTVVNRDRAEEANEMSKKTKGSVADVITLSGCKDNQTSADAKEQGQSTGAMSYAFISVMQSNPNQTYLSLLQETREILLAKYSQKPQLCSSHPIDTGLQFII